MAKPRVSWPPVQVPDDTSISIATVSEKSALFRSQSGFLMADLGPEEFIETKFKGVEHVLEKEPTLSTIWVLQDAVQHYWAADSIRTAELLRRFYRIQSLRIARGGAGKEMMSLWMPGSFMLSDMVAPNPKVEHRRIADIVVLTDTGLATKHLMSLLSLMGITTHTPEPVGHEYFVEVHKPDRTIVGLAGERMMEPSPQPILNHLYRERDRLRKSGDSEAKLRELERTEMALIDKAKDSVMPLGRKLLRKIKPKPGIPLLSSMMIGLTKQNLPSFLRTFSHSTLGVSLSGGVDMGDSQIVTTKDSPGKVALTNSSDGKPRLLVCADPPLYEMRFERGGYNALISGSYAFKIVQADPDCAGIYVNNALKESGVLISREDALKALKS